MRLVQRLIRRRIAALALAAVCALVLAAPVSARVAPIDRGAAGHFSSAATSQTDPPTVLAGDGAIKAATPSKVLAGDGAIKAATPSTVLAGDGAVKVAATPSTIAPVSDVRSAAGTGYHADPVSSSTIGSAGPDGNAVTVLALVLALVGTAALAAGGASAVTSRIVRSHQHPA